jgi:hypothetical protein
MRLRSCKTVEDAGQKQADRHERGDMKLTGNAGEELAGKLLDVSAGKGHKLVALEKVKDALAQQVGDDADVVAKVKRVA